MKAMILAAGIGSRLRPLTDKIPKALVRVAGVPMLEIVLQRLKAAGVGEVIVNVHHLADRIADFLKTRRNFGLRIELSHEPELLETGGGLKEARWFFDDGKPFFLYNVDIFSDVDLGSLYAAHVKGGPLAPSAELRGLAVPSERGPYPLATLSVRRRDTDRYFLFDESGRLCGWESVKERRKEWSGNPVPDAQRLAFDGISVISPAIFPNMTEAGAFSLNRVLLRLAGEGETIQAFRSDGWYWNTIGDDARLEEVRRRARGGQ